MQSINGFKNLVSEKSNLNCKIRGNGIKLKKEKHIKNDIVIVFS